MKIYIDFDKLQITKIVQDVMYKGDVLSNAFELLFYNCSDTSWYPTMSQLAPNDRQAGDFAADALEEGESQTVIEDDITYLRYKFTIGAGWVLVKGKSEFFIWKNTVTPMTRKCIGKVVVTLNESTDNYFIDDITVNPTIKKYLDDSFEEQYNYIDGKLEDFENDYEEEVDAQRDLINNLIGGEPRYVNTASNILALTTDKGVAVATDTGKWYYYDENSTPKYVEGGDYLGTGDVVTNDGNQLKDGDGNNIYPNLETITNLEIDLPLEDVYKVNHLETAGGNINASVRFLANDIIEKNTIIKSVDMYVGATAYASGTIYLEIWEKTNSTTIERKFTTNVTNNNTTGTINIPVNYVTTASAYIVVYRVGTFLPQIVYNAFETNGVLFIADISSTSLTLASLSQYSGHLSLRANCVILKNTQKLANTIYVGPNGDFTTIQEAINSIVDDASNNPYTIIVDKGTYARFSMRSSVTGISRMRYISIIGIDKMACVIYDDTGHYVTGSCDYWGQGSIENLTIKVDHTNDSSEENRKAYALHMDFGQCNVVVRNCILQSSNGPAVGIGMYQDTYITFENCDIYSDCPSDYTALLNYGALFCHGNTSSGVTNQNLNVYNCRVISKYGDRGAWFSNPGHNSVTINSINTLYYTGAVGGTKVVLDDVSVTPYSYGNSATNLNN